jgi:hypothetical protein
MADSRLSIGIPNLFNGVSQQASNLRLTSQAATQTNLFSSLVRGLVKRPPTTHIKRLIDSGNNDNSGLFTHFADRGDTEKYLFLMGHQSLKVFSKTDGTEYPVYSPNGLTYLTVTNTARDDFRAVSLADYTIVTNRNTIVTMDSTETLAPIPDNTAYVWVKRGNYGTAYVVNIAGTNYTYTTADPLATDPTYVATDEIAAGIVTAIGALAGYTISRNGSLVKIVKASGTFTFAVSDSYASEALIGLKVNVARREDLPDVGEDGMSFKIIGASNDSDEAYYVKYSSNSGQYRGVWEETRGWNQYNKFAPSTMPHKIVRYYVTGTEAGALDTWITNTGLDTGDVYFLFDRLTWNDRLVGDETTAKTPEFVGSTITDVFFHATRLGLLSGEWLFLSRTGDFFNYWPKTVRQALDDGPISVSTGQITGLHAAVPWNSALLVFSGRNQYQVTSNGALTPTSAKADEATTFDSSPLSHPVASGPNVYFSSTRTPFSVVREYFISDDGVSNDAVNITGHVPEYIPAGVFQMAASSNEDVLMVLTTGQRDSIYLYKYYWSGRDKLQSSWSTFQFLGATILGIHFFGENISMVLLREGDVYLEELPIQVYSVDSGLPYLVRLDRKCSVTGVYNGTTNKTTFTLPYEEAVATQLAVVLGSAFVGRAGAPILIGERPTVTTLTLNGDITAGPVFIGKLYESKYTFSPFYIRAEDEAKSAILTGKLTIQELVVTYDLSGDFRFEVDIEGRDTYVQRKTGYLGSGDYKIGEVFLDSGIAHCGVQALNTDVTVSLINDSPFPSRWLNGEVIATYDSIQRRI